ncbi:restriction endonuclease [Bacillus sp. 37MA]|nr:restriction endonuclease [Bacillus sp. 37MA]
MAKMKYKNEADTLFDKTLLGLMGFLIVSHFVLPLVIQPRDDFFIIIVIIIISVAVYVYFRSDGQNVKKRKFLQSDIKEIDTMQKVEFKLYVEELFKNMGYKVNLIGDYGADLLLKKDGKSIAVQVKKYSKTVGVTSVQQVFSAKTYYKANEAWVVTNNTFTKNACDLAKKSGVKLVDRGQLIHFMSKI